MRTLKNVFKIKSEKEFIFRITSILFITFLLSCKMCEQPFEPNPNLKLLLKEEGYDLLNPVWTKSGWIYYIREGDGIWRIREDGTEKEFIISGNFTSIDVSPSESLIAGIEMGKLLVLINLSNLYVDTLINVKKVLFGRSDSILWCKKEDMIMRITIHSFTNYDYDTLLNGVSHFYDVFKDSLILYSKLVSQQEGNYDIYIYVIFLQNEEKLSIFSTRGVFIFSPITPYLLLSEEYEGRRFDFKLINWSTNEEKLLDASPYEISILRDKNFDPQGKKIVFSASQGIKGDPIKFENFELWILDKF